MRDCAQGIVPTCNNVNVYYLVVIIRAIVSGVAKEAQFKGTALRGEYRRSA
jgi:hypothetical protein